MLDRRKIGRMLATIAGSRHGISLRNLSHLVDCDPSTIKRNIEKLRWEYSAPIESYRRGYFWKPSEQEKKRAEALLIVFCDTDRVGQ